MTIPCQSSILSKFNATTLASFCGQLQLAGEVVSSELVSPHEVRQQLGLSKRHSGLLKQLQGDQQGIIFLRASRRATTVVCCTSIAAALASRQASLLALEKARNYYQQAEEQVNRYEATGRVFAAVRKRLSQAAAQVDAAMDEVYHRAFWVIPNPTSLQKEAFSKLFNILAHQSKSGEKQPVLFQYIAATGK